jgi:hypothetical protein
MSEVWGDLADLYFGRDDAEMDIAEGGLLRAGFLSTAAYVAARKAHKDLIIGRKGSGKSAICRMLEASRDETALVTPDEVSADEMRRFELQGITPEQAKELVWRYILEVQVAKYLVAHAQAQHAKSKLTAVDSLRKFLIANNEWDPTFPEKFWQAIQRLKGSVSLEALGMKANAEFKGLSEGVRVSGELDVIHKAIMKAIAELACGNDHPRLLLLVDQIDDIWSDSKESRQMVVGLLRAARRVSSTLSSRAACVVFLRSDIYDMVEFDNKDKLHGGETRVDWTAERLLEMTLSRARASLGHDLTGAELWSAIFPQTVAGLSSPEHVVGHTLMRPRDIIHLCNLCRDVAEQNGHDTISESDVRDATDQYSQWKLRDLATEYRINYPFLAGVTALFRDSGYVVAREGFEKRFAEALATLRKRFPAHADALTPGSVLDILYRIGFLGIRRGPSITYGYDLKTRIEPTDSEFYLHPCFRSALGATRATTKYHYQPNELVSRVRGQLRSPDLLESETVGPEFSMLESVRGGGQRILDRLHGTAFPPAVRQEIKDDIRRMLRDTARIEERYAAHPEAVDVVDHVYWVVDFLTSLSGQLQGNGYGDREETRFFVRWIEDVAAQLRDEATGSAAYS